MRNLKRALSLALASVMLLGMMVVGTSAAIADVDPEKHNVEALEVLNMVGAMIGDGKNLNPDAYVTRNEAAVMITNLMGMTMEDKKAYADTAFEDVPEWAAPHVNAFFYEGFTSGVSATEFGGTQTVTAAQLSLWVMKALGYFEYSSDMGVDWAESQLFIAKQAAGLKLYKGLDKAPKSGDAVTRNDFAQIVFNALQMGMPTSALNGTKVDSNGKTVNNYVYTVANTAPTLADKLFDSNDGDVVKGDSKLTSNPAGTDAYGRTVTEWSFGAGKKVQAPAKAADYVLVATKDIKLDALIKAEGLADAIEGEPATLYPAGTVIELTLASDDTIATTKTYTYKAFEIKKVTALDAKKDEAEIKKTGAAYEIQIDTIGTIYDTQIANFDAATYVKGAYIVFPYIADYAKDPIALAKNNTDGTKTLPIYVDTTIAATEVAAVSATADKYYRVGETKIEIEAVADTVAAGKEYTFYLDPNGVALKAVEVEDEEAVTAEATLADVLYVITSFKSSSVDEYGVATDYYYAQVMSLEGVAENILIGKVVDPTGTPVSYGATSATPGALVTTKVYEKKTTVSAVTYLPETIQLKTWNPADVKANEGDTEYQYEKAIYATNSVSTTPYVTEKSEKAGSVYLTGEQKYIFVSGVKGDLEIEVLEGAQAVKLKGTNSDSGLTISNTFISNIDEDGNKIAAYVIVKNGEEYVDGAPTEYKDVVYVDQSAGTEGSFLVVDDKNVPAELAVVYDETGAEKTIYLADGASLPADGFYTYTIDEDGFYALVNNVDEYDNETTIDAAGADAGKVLAFTYAGKFQTKIKTAVGDIEAKDAKWLNLVKDSEIADLETLTEAYENKDQVTLTIYVKADAAALIVVTNVVPFA